MPEQDDLGRTIIRYGCGVCGRVLEPGPFGWRHAYVDERTADHPAVPVPVEEMAEQLLQRCDFCLAENPTHTLPVRPFEHPLFPDGKNTDDYAVCAACAVLLGRDDWEALFRRVIRIHERMEGVKMPMPVLNVMRKTIDLVRVNVYAPLREGLD